MVNPLAAQAIIPSPVAAEMNDRIEIFRTLIQRNSSGQLMAKQASEGGHATSRQSIWVEGWVHYKENVSEDWRAAWGTVEGGCVWFFAKPEVSFFSSFPPS